jgi:hypothetical protein
LKIKMKFKRKRKIKRIKIWLLQNKIMKIKFEKKTMRKIKKISKMKYRIDIIYFFRMNLKKQLLVRYGLVKRFQEKRKMIWIQTFIKTLEEAETQRLNKFLYSISFMVEYMNLKILIWRKWRQNYWKLRKCTPIECKIATENGIVKKTEIKS